MSVRAVQKTESDAIIERLLALDDAPSRAQLVAQHPAIAWDEIVMILTEKFGKRFASTPIGPSDWRYSPGCCANTRQSKSACPKFTREGERDVRTRRAR